MLTEGSTCHVWLAPDLFVLFLKFQAFVILLLLGHCLGSIVKRQSHEDIMSEVLTIIENEGESGMLRVTRYKRHRLFSEQACVTLIIQSVIKTDNLIGLTS